MKKIIVAAVALFAAGAAQAATGVSNLQFLEAARCRGLAASETLGKVDTSAIDAFLRQEGSSRELPVRASASKKIVGAQKEADKAEGDKKAKLLAERDGVCAVWIAGGQDAAKS